MKQKFFVVMLFVGILIILIEVVSIGYAQEPEPKVEVQAALDTTFTYQGRLKVSNQVVSGTYEFQFSLYDQLTDGNQVGSTIDKTIVVTDGLFTVKLDFGSSVFAGEARYMEIGVRTGGSAGGYTTLSPRQELTAVPYAFYTLEAGSVNWSSVISVPSGFSDGVDDDTTYSNGPGLVLSNTTFSVDFNTVASSTHTHPGSDITSVVSTATLAISATQAPWNGITNVPSGFADGVDDVGLTDVTWTDVQSRPIGLDDGDDDTTYLAGLGLTLSNTLFTVNFGGNGISNTVAHADHTHNSLDAADGNPTDAVYVDNDGRVGIGTASPNSKIEVIQPSLFPDDQDVGIRVAREDDNNKWIQMRAGGVSVDLESRNTPLYINYGPCSEYGDCQDVYLVGAGGNVSIGTISPTAKLTIQGNISDTQTPLFISSADVADGKNHELQIGLKHNNSGIPWLYRMGQDHNGDFLVTHDAGNGYGIPRLMIQSSGNVGIGITSPTHILHVNGIARSTQSTWATSSDARVKTNIQPLTGSLEKILQLNPVTFEYTETYKENNKALDGRKVGFIAQEVAEVDSSMVSTVRETFGNTVIEDFYILDSSNIVPMLVDAVKEQQSMIDDLKQQNAQLEERLAALEALLSRQ